MATVTDKRADLAGPDIGDYARARADPPTDTPLFSPIETMKRAEAEEA